MSNEERWMLSSNAIAKRFYELGMIEGIKQVGNKIDDTQVNKIWLKKLEEMK